MNKKINDVLNFNNVITIRMNSLTLTQMPKEKYVNSIDLYDCLSLERLTSFITHLR